MSENEAKRAVTLARSSYQPSNAELEEPIVFPEGTTPGAHAAGGYYLEDSPG